MDWLPLARTPPRAEEPATEVPALDWDLNPGPQAHALSTGPKQPGPVWCFRANTEMQDLRPGTLHPRAGRKC